MGDARTSGPVLRGEYGTQVTWFYARPTTIPIVCINYCLLRSGIGRLEKISRKFLSAESNWEQLSAARMSSILWFRCVWCVRSQKVVLSMPQYVTCTRRTSLRYSKIQDIVGKRTSAAFQQAKKKVPHSYTKITYTKAVPIRMLELLKFREQQGKVRLEKLTQKKWPKSFTATT